MAKTIKKTAAKAAPSTKKTASAARKPATKRAAKKPTTRKPAAKASTKKAATKKAAAKPKAAAARKPAAKAAAARKPAAKKPSAKRPAAKTSSTKSAATKRSTSTKVVDGIKTTLRETKVPTPKRPATNPSVPMGTVDHISAMFADIRSILENYAANLRPLDRRRINGVGIKKQGFIERAYEYALENVNFLPQYLTIEKFTEDRDYFVNLRLIFDMCTQLREIIWNLTLQAADVTFTDALDFYAAVREASHRRIDGAETIHKDLEFFFRRPSRGAADEPTEKMLKRDMNALLHGKRDGKVVIENIKPKVSGGVHKVVDETFRDTAEYKESAEGKVEI